MSDSPKKDAPKVIVITNLDYSTSFMDLSAMFSRFGAIRSANVAQKLTKTGNCLTGYGTVVFFESEAAAKAKAEMNGYMHRGKPMVIGFERPSADWADKLQE